MAEKKLLDVFCENSGCRAFLCQTDRTFLFVENLEILPKVETVKKKGERHVKNLICPECGAKTKIYLNKLKAAARKNTPRKFSIFRSRF